MAVSSIRTGNVERIERTPRSRPTVSAPVKPSGGMPEDDEPYEVWTAGDEPRAAENARRVLGGLGGNDREGALVEAGRLYGRDHARARTALADGTHPLCRLKRPTG